MSMRVLSLSIVMAAGLVSPAVAGAQTAPPPTVTAPPQDGFAIQAPNADYRLVFNAVAQMDGRFSLDDPTPIVDTFTLRKVRPILSGRITKYFDFRIMPDFGNGTVVVQDAYLDVRFSPTFRVRTGKDKTPVGYELLQGDPFLLFPERSLASSLVPNRDIGVQVLGDLTPKVFYAAGLFNGVLDGVSTTTDVDTNNGKDLAGRIVWQPFRSSGAPARGLNGLGFQVGGSTGTQSGAVLPFFRTSVGQTYFAYAASAAASGGRRRLTPAVFYYYKSFGGFAEYVQSTQSVARAGVERDFTNRGWDVTGSFLLTGEAASDRGVRPTSPFDPANGKWGALQVVARYSVLSVDRDIFALGFGAATASREARSFAVGLNWYPITFVKYYATYERTTFNGGNAPRPSEDSVVFRVQLAF